MKKPIRTSGASPATSSKAVGDDLERRVAKFYEALGYQVTRDLLIAGHQVDLLASRYIPGLGEVQVAVEVKHRSKIVGINEITPFLLTAAHILNNSQVSSVTFATDSSFSPKARLAADPIKSIKLLTVDDLDAQLFNNAESLFRVIKDYEHKPIYGDYYPLEVAVGRRDFPDGVTYLVSWLANPSSRLLLVIGDFGSGKSTILERAFYQAAKERIHSPKARFPALFRLRGMRQYSDVWQFVEASLRDYQYITPPRAVFENELKSGRVAIFLDGFDEIYSGANAQDRGAYLDFLRPLIRTKSPVILSSRPTFFDSFNDIISEARRLLGKEDTMQRLPGFGLDQRRIAQAFGAEVDQSLKRGDFTQVMTIKQLDAEKIREAIQKREADIRVSLGMSTASFEEALYDIYDLEDLMTRPLLLDMILKTTATGMIDIKSQTKVGASTLYDIYTQQAAKRDKDRTAYDQFLTPAFRLDACRSLARSMLRKGEITLTSHEVIQCVEEVTRERVKSRRSREEIARAVTDIRTCSFLRFSDDGSLTFTHKSFYEFFIAQDIYLASKLSARKFLSYPRERINRETVYFLCSYARDLDDFSDFISLRLREKHSKEDKSFLQSLAFASGLILEKNPLSVGTVIGAELAKARVDGADATLMAIRSSVVRKVKCINWKFQDVSFEDCKFSDVDIVDSIFHISSQTTSFEKTRFEKSDVSFSGDDLTLDDVVVEASDLTIDCSTVVKSVAITGCGRVVLGPSSNLSSQDLQFRKSAIFSENPRRWYSPTAKMELYSCDLVGIRLYSTDLFTDFQTRLENRVRLVDCTGLIFLDFAPDFIKAGGLESLKKRNPALLLLDEKVMAEVRRFLASFDQKTPAVNKTDPSSPASRESSIPSRLIAELGPLGDLAIRLTEYTRNRRPGQLGLPRSLQEFVTKAATVLVDQRR